MKWRLCLRWRMVLWKRLNTEMDPKKSLGPFPSFFKNYRKSLFWVRFRFSEKVVNSQFVVQFPLFLGPFPLFWVRFRFSKKVSNSQFVDRFPLFWVCFLIFWVIFRMYIKLLVLVGFDLHFPLISGISKLHLSNRFIS